MDSASNNPQDQDGQEFSDLPCAQHMPQIAALEQSLQDGTFADNPMYKRQEQVNFHSRRLRKEDIKKPWLYKPQTTKEKLADALPLIGAFLGAVVAGVLVWDGWNSVVNHNYVLLYEDDFSNGLDRSIWEPEIQVGGFG